MREDLNKPERIAKLELELGDAEDRIERLRARSAKLVAALSQIVSHDPDGWEASIARAALSETVEA